MRCHNSLVIAVLPGPQIAAKQTKTKQKRRVAHVADVQTTRSGRKQKANRFTSNLIVVLIVIAIIMYFYFLS